MWFSLLLLFFFFFLRARDRRFTFLSALECVGLKGLRVHVRRGRLSRLPEK